MTNRVDELKGEIKELQDTCVHEWTITKSHDELKESLQPGTYQGRDGWSYLGGRDHFSISCSECSLVRDLSYYITCPKCFETLKVNDKLSWRENYKEDRYKQYGYYAIRLSHCPNNDFAVANDEFDQ